MPFGGNKARYQPNGFERHATLLIMICLDRSRLPKDIKVAAVLILCLYFVYCACTVVSKRSHKVSDNQRI
jgi:hypothetical protein